MLIPFSYSESQGGPGGEETDVTETFSSQKKKRKIPDRLSDRQAGPAPGVMLAVLGCRAHCVYL